MLRESLSHGWLFSRGGDDGFESVIIPHDGMLGAPRSAGAPSGSAQGYFEGGTSRSPALMPSSLIRTGIRGQASIAPRGFGRGRATATLHLGM